MPHAKMPPWTNARSSESEARRHEWATRFRRKYGSLGTSKTDLDDAMQRAYALYDATDSLGMYDPEAAAWEVLRRELLAAEGGGVGAGSGG